MANLYEMTEQAHQLKEMLEAGDIDEEILKDTLDSIGADEKLQSYAYIIKELDSDIDKFKAEEKRLAERRKTLENGVGRMKEAVEKYMNVLGEEKTEAGTFTFRINHTKAVQILDEDLIPAEYKVEQPAKISKADIKKAIADGKTVAGATMVENTSVVIR